MERQTQDVGHRGFGEKGGGRREGKLTYPGSTNGHVQDEIHGALAKSRPDTSIPDARSHDLVELAAIDEPREGLLPPVAASTIKLDAPDMEVVAAEADGAADARGLVADASGVLLAMDGAMADHLPVELLHDINLPAAGPFASMAQRVSQHPERGPEALLAGRRVGAEPDRGLDAGDAAGRRGEDVSALETARRPSLDGAVVPQGHNLERVGAAELDVARAGRVRLQLAVDVEEAADAVPVASAGGTALSAGKVVCPTEREARIVGGAGVDCGRKGQQDARQEVAVDHCWFLFRSVVGVVARLGRRRR